MGRQIPDVLHDGTNTPYVTVNARGNDVAETKPWSESGDAKEDAGVFLAELSEPFGRRIPHSKARVESAELHGPELRVLERPPTSDDAPTVVIAIPFAHGEDVVARPPVVIPNERTVHRERYLPKEIP